MNKSISEAVYKVIKERIGTKEFVQLVNAETGEIEYALWNEQKKKPTGRPPERTKTPEFFKVYRTNWMDIVLKKRLTLAEIGFFMSLLVFVDWESNFLVHPKTKENLSAREIADLLGIDHSNVLEYLSRLNKKGIIAILNVGGKGCPNHYLLNSNLVFRGIKAKDLNEIERFNKDCPYIPPVKVNYEPRILPKQEEEMDEKGIYITSFHEQDGEQGEG